MKIAFIGLGHMGGPMAINLHKAGMLGMATVGAHMTTSDCVAVHMPPLS